MVDQFPTDPRLSRILDRLNRLVSPGAAHFFADACRLVALSTEVGSAGAEEGGAIARPKFYATTHLVGHLVREIESALRAVIVTKRTPKSENAHHGQIDAVCNALDIDKGDAVVSAWKQLAADKKAHRDALSPPRPFDGDFQAFWDRAVSVFDLVLDRFEPKFQIAYRRVDELRAAPSCERLANEIPRNPMLLERFFREPLPFHLIAALKKERFLARTPEAVPAAIRFARAIAGKSPDVASKIATEIKSFDNPFVLAEYLELMNALSEGKLSRRLVDVVIKWTRAHARFGNVEQSLFARFAALIKRLTAENRLDEARRLFTLFVSAPAPKRATGPVISSIHPATRLDSWHYGELLRQTAPGLVEKDPFGSIAIMCDALPAIAAMRSVPGQPEEDQSYFWRDHIRDGGLLLIPAHRDSLLNAIRDGAVQEVRRHPAAIEKMIDLLIGRRRRIFDRLAYWLLTQSLQTARGRRLAKRLVLDPRRFERPRPDVEEADLLAGLYPRLGATARARIAAMIDAGPKLRVGKRRAFDRDTEARLNSIWRRDRLASIHEWLDARQRTAYAAAVEHVGSPLAERKARFEAGAFGPTSPTAKESLASLEPRELAGFLRNWTPPDTRDIMAPSMSGLGETLKNVFAEAPERYVAHLESFKDVDPTYARSMVGGFLAASRAGKPLAWSPILAFCGWIVAQPRDPAEDKTDLHFDRDGSWRWARCGVIELLSAGLDSPTDPIPCDLLDAAWSVAEPITRDPDPSFDGTGEPEGDASTVAINSTRGQALHFAFKYLLRRRREFEESSGGDTFSLSLLPRVREVFDERLDERSEGKPAVRSVFGLWFWHMLTIDPAWATASLRKIFGSPGTAGASARAAWSAFLRFGRRSNETFRSLREHYVAAVRDVGRVPFDPTKADSSDAASLGEHIASYYWNAVIGIDDTILVGFYADASDELRAHVADFLGRSLNGADIPGPVVERMRAFWDWRAEQTRAGGASRAELASFAWWYGCGKFDEAWAAARLIDAAERAGQLDPEFAVLSRLASVAPENPKRALKCLDAVVRSAQNPWAFLGCQEDIRTVIEAGLAQASTAALASGVASRLAAKGLKAFEDLALSDVRIVPDEQDSL